MTNKKFKKAAMALALTACVAATPLAANAETPENAAGVQAPAAVDHTEADTQEAPEAELPVEEEPEAQPAAEAAAQPAAPEATPIAVELPTAEETPEEKEETPVEVTPTEDAVVEKETPAKVAPAPAKADVDNLIEDPDADIATMDGAEKEVSGDEAKIGDTSYSTLQDAIDGAKAGNEVVLQKNHTGNIKIAEWIKLNLNGKKIEGNVEVDLSKKQDAPATSQDGETTVDKKVEIVDGTITGATDSGVTIKDAGNTNVLLKDLTIEENQGKQGGGVHIENSQNVTIDNCTIQNNKTTEVSKNGTDVSVGAGGGVYISNSGVIIRDSTIQSNTGTRGGGVYVEKGSTVDVKDSNIDKNIATDVPSDEPNSNKGLGGGIYSFDSTLTVTGGTISGNEAKGSTSLIISNDGELSSSTLGNGGGGIEAQGGSLTVKDSTISNNNAQGNGGGIFSAEGNELNISGSTIQGNKADNGGGIHMGEARDTSKTPSKATITDTKILENEAIGSGEGGGVYVGGPRADATLKGCTVANNKAVSTGGGIAAKLGTVTLDDTTVENNQAVNGGGLFHLGIAVPGSLTLQNGSIIRNNTASSMGGGLFLWGNVGLKSVNSEISGNKALYGAGIAASQYLANFPSPKLELVNTKVNSNGDASTVMGGGIYAAQGVVLNAKNTKLLDNTAKSGGGILLWSNSSADLNNSEVSGNKATGDGGGVYIWDSTCSLTASNGTVFRENSASNGGGILNNGVLTLKKGTSLVENSAGLYGGGLCSSGTVEVESGAKLYNNHAAQAGDDVYLFGKGSTLTLTKVGDDWMLDDCGHKINGWFADLLDARWDADGKQEHVINLKDYAADGLTIVENEDGSYTITILDENATLALKAAHNVTPKPTPDPDPEPTPDPDTPDTPVSPEGPTTPPVQDVTPDEAETPVNPENPANPSVQDATPDSTVAALPKTGVNWFTALAMALSGMALTVAGAFTSLFAKSKH